ncbi:Dolichyl-diphosphooligosaccharide-protein glycosyltransferase subunit dad1 [Stylosanthes scabra]|uniref:Dolichyl-diphosphooligosaccharide-protein glycosyltransferase subunit dad1 n=1 Tax=Stylosanthes scabra TaxID=79078 RepID=A0ABU6UEA2_9FABA|nr:Dolichyl-diphosphooligosaccharide-protein glycosyltransferase subunit dad1 [Stylosanthes scabra]
MRLPIIRASSSSITKSNPIITLSQDESNTPRFPFNHCTHSWCQLKPTSPKCKSPKLGLKWKQYQGINHWKDLLDPLDDNLRWEILRYGHFVDAAYRSFDFDPSSPTYATCHHPRSSLLNRCGIVGSGYRLTKNLRATCGIHVPAWVTKMSTWTCNPSSWIGYIAICEHRKEIIRLGRRDVVIAFRGTATCMEWLENLRATLTHLPNQVEGKDDIAPMVQKGFLSLYTSKTSKQASLQEMVREEIGRVIKSYRNEPLSLTLTGHSLGAALAILSAYDITATFENPPMVTVVSFGGPRVGNKSFRRILEQNGIKILRIVNPDDVFTRVPGFSVSKNESDVEGNEDVHVARLLGWLHRRVEDMQLVYADVGQELRLSSKDLPYLKHGDVATCHDLKTYLHLVKGFVSSSCCPCTQKTINSMWPKAWL